MPCSELDSKLILSGYPQAALATGKTGEELLQAPSFPVWRRLGTVIHLPRKAGGPMVDQVATVNPAALEAVPALDAADG
jgi:hypothetical protein